MSADRDDVFEIEVCDDALAFQKRVRVEPVSTACSWCRSVLHEEVKCPRRARLRSTWLSD